MLVDIATSSHKAYAPIGGAFSYGYFYWFR